MEECEPAMSDEPKSDEPKSDEPEAPSDEAMGVRATLNIRDEEIHVIRRPENAHLDQKPDQPESPDPA